VKTAVRAIADYPVPGVVIKTTIKARMPQTNFGIKLGTLAEQIEHQKHEPYPESAIGF
jgi:hypothetical protein